MQSWILVQNHASDLWIRPTSLDMPIWEHGPWKIVTNLPYYKILPTCLNANGDVLLPLSPTCGSALSYIKFYRHLVPMEIDYICPIISIMIIWPKSYHKKTHNFVYRSIWQAQYINFKKHISHILLSRQQIFKIVWNINSVGIKLICTYQRGSKWTMEKYVMMRLAHMCVENTLTILGPIINMIGRTLLGWSLDPSYNFYISNLRWQST